MDEYHHDENKSPAAETPIEISMSQISQEALRGIVEGFIMREGTDYGAAEVSFEKKFEQIYRQIEKGDIKIVFDQATESVNLLTKRDFQRIIRES